MGTLPQNTSFLRGFTLKTPPFYEDLLSEQPGLGGFTLRTACFRWFYPQNTSFLRKVTLKTPPFYGKLPSEQPVLTSFFLSPG